VHIYKAELIKSFVDGGIKMKNLVIATVLVMLAPSLGFAGQLDKNKCEQKVHDSRAKLRREANAKREAENAQNRRSTNSGRRQSLDRG
jgi:hypothetical protein